ncbi:MAG: alpha/beta hydrolase [Candidatus Planktophila sp.]|nr:alpha/beta hydrolase [Candidatus Planktophila sp.]
MSLHPHAASFLEMAKAANLPDISVQGARVARGYSHGQPDLGGVIDPTVDISIEFFTSSTADIAVAIYTPPATSDAKRAGIVYFHGGGWVINYIAKYHAQMASMAKKTNSIIVSVNYQKAPEHKFPIPFNDCYEGLEWTVANADRLGIDLDRLGVGGDSAGGNLASAVALAARDRGKIKLAFQWLIYPCNGPEFVDASDVPNADGYGLTQRGMKWLWEMYLNGDVDRSNPYAVPHAAKSLEGLPPTIMITAEYDVLKADGVAYYEKLKAAGNDVVYKDCPGMIHGFFNLGKFIEDGITIRDWFAENILRVVGK